MKSNKYQQIYIKDSNLHLSWVGPKRAQRPNVSSPLLLFPLIFDLIWVDHESQVQAVVSSQFPQVWEPFQSFANLFPIFKIT